MSGSQDDVNADIHILGPIEVIRGGGDVRLGPQQIVLLAILVTGHGQVVSRSRLIDALWGDEAAQGADATLRSHVLHLRRALEPHWRSGTKPRVLLAGGTGYASGYCLRIGPEQLDAIRFERSYQRGRTALDDGDPERARDTLQAALELWRGRALADVADRPFAMAEATRLEEMGIAAGRLYLRAGLLLERYSEVVAEAVTAVAAIPHDETMRRYLAMALYRSGRRDEAVATCREGLELSHERGLQASSLEYLQTAILRDEYVPVLGKGARL